MPLVDARMDLPSGATTSVMGPTVAMLNLRTLPEREMSVRAKWVVEGLGA